MRYKFALICIILVAFVIPGRGDQVIADGVILTSLVRVLAHPEKYQGKQIELIGYYVSEFEHHALYLTKDDPEVGNTQNGIWIGSSSAQADKSKINTRVKKGYVRVIGTFNYNSNGGSGHLSAWPAEIKDITFLNITK